MKRILLTRDLWSGMLFAAFGVAALTLGHDLRIGSAARMGPGFVPHAIGWSLIAFGAVIAAKGLFANAERIGAIAWRPVVLILLSVVMFALVLQPAGLLPAIVALIALSVLAGRDGQLGPTLGLAAFLVVFCIALFKFALGMNFPVIAGIW
ncbi:tripartite tricarboxylate transporter TctB family protein [Bradyrhizobium lablabi]|uniref:tripartite tricarboxylate transporter TctB family protein n=1 Tax=Bradyrhizobium lablabi TaxID=722472 RepID=UPI0018F8C2D9|nr:tripartite tricarboxylate transporter TctB family protein [Bradyrhizobium lablabi]